MANDNNDNGNISREQYEKALKEIKDLKAFKNETVVKSFLTSKGIKASVARFIPEDIKGDEAKLEEWYADEDNADAFGFTSQPGQPAEVVTPESSAPAIDPTALSAAQGLASRVRGSQTPSAVSSLEQEIAAAKTPEQIDAIIAKYSAN